MNTTQPKTWIGHGLLALAAAILPASATLAFGGDPYLRWLVGLISCSAMTLYFIWREERDEDAKKESGTWSWVWVWDKFGDLLGPIAVWVTWLSAGLLL